MKIYNNIISLGQYCITSTALRRNNLQAESSVFDWSAGIIPEKCGLGGLSGKVDLICNDFKDFFNFEDFENRGNNQENDTYNLWIVNKRTGLQYKHDFPAAVPFEEQFPKVKEKYLRRIKRLYETISPDKKILFCFFARDTGFSDELLIEQQKKLAKKFPKTDIDFLYILHSPECKIDEFNTFVLNEHVTKIEMNFTHPSDPNYPESWNGNTQIYYPPLRNMICSTYTISLLNNKLIELQYEHKNLLQRIAEIEKQNSFIRDELLNTKLPFFMKKTAKHYVFSILGIKIKFKCKSNHR